MITMTFKQKGFNKQIDWNWVIESNESIRILAKICDDAFCCSKSAINTHAVSISEWQRIDEPNYNGEKKPFPKQAVVPPGSHSVGTCLVFYRKENSISTNRASPKGNLFSFLPHLSVLQKYLFCFATPKHTAEEA